MEGRSRGVKAGEFRGGLRSRPLPGRVATAAARVLQIPARNAILYQKTCRAGAPGGPRPPPPRPRALQGMEFCLQHGRQEGQAAKSQAWRLPQESKQESTPAQRPNSQFRATRRHETRDPWTYGWSRAMPNRHQGWTSGGKEGCRGG